MSSSTVEESNISCLSVSYWWLFCVRALIPTHVSFGFAALPENSRMWSPDFLSWRVFTSWWIFRGLMFTVWQFQVECVSAFEPASCSTLRRSRAVTSPLILKSGARIQIITEKLINVFLKVNNEQYLRIEGDEHGEGPHCCQNRFYLNYTSDFRRHQCSLKVSEVMRSRTLNRNRSCSRTLIHKVSCSYLQLNNSKMYKQHFKVI